MTNKNGQGETQIPFGDTKEEQEQRQTQIPFGNDNKKDEGKSKREPQPATAVTAKGETA